MNEFEISVRFKPDHVDAHYNLGLAYVAQGRMDEAINEYKTVIILKPDYAEAHNNLGLAYIDQGRIDEAIKEFQTLMKISPVNHPSARRFVDFLQKK